MSTYETCVLMWFAVILVVCECFFFFKQKTAYEMRISDWSSDVCSSDLADTRVDPGDDRKADRFRNQRQRDDDPGQNFAAQRSAVGEPLLAIGRQGNGH